MKLPYLVIVLALGTLVSPARAADNLKLNPQLDYNTDSQDGPLITGDNMSAGIVSGQPNYILIYAEACYNSKRQARRTVALYNAYRSRIHFVIIDLDLPRSPEQQALVKKYFQGYIPHVAVLDRNGKPVYSQPGEIPTQNLEQIFKQILDNTRQ